MKLQAMKSGVNSHHWMAGMLLSGFVAFSLVGVIVLTPCWWAACGGWSLVALNSMAARVIRDQSVGVSRAAFMGWGVIANAIRMLTLIVIFAYMTVFFPGERGSFLISGLSAFFVMMPVEVMQLFKSQTKVAEKLECGRDAN